MECFKKMQKNTCHEFRKISKRNKNQIPPPTPLALHDRLILSAVKTGRSILLFDISCGRMKLKAAYVTSGNSPLDAKFNVGELK